MGDLSYEITNNNRKTNILLYGPAKTRKTTWIGMAAAMGIHVYIFDGDKGAEVLIQLDKSLHKFIHIINCWDEPGGANFQSFIARFLKRQPFYWNDTKRRSEAYLGKEFNNEDAYWYIQPGLVNKSMLLSIDSWTKMVISIVMDYAMKNNFDLSDPTALDNDKWTYFRHAGLVADYTLNQFFGLDCHVAVVGHETVYEKRGEDAEGKSIIESQHTQPVSVSGPHGMKISAIFDHVLKFGVNALGETSIDLRTNHKADGGSRFIEPKLYNFKSLSFSDILKAGHIEPMTDLSQDAFVFYPPGEVNKHLEENKQKALTGGKKQPPKVNPMNAPLTTKKKQTVPLTLTSIGNANG